MDNWKTALAVYGMMTLNFVIVGIMTYYAIYKQALASYIYYIALAFFLGQFCVVYFFVSGIQWNDVSLFIILVVLNLLILAVTYYFAVVKTSSFGNGSNTAAYTLAAFSTLIGLAILYGFGKQFFTAYKHEKKPTWFGFLINLIFFIPCMFYDFAQYFTEEWMRTSMPIIFLLFFEIFVIILYFIWPQLNWNTNETTQLLPQPVFLKTQVVISGSQPMIINNVVSNPDNPAAAINNIRTDYALSMWIYINDYKTVTNREVANNRGHVKQVFCYGNQGSGNPLIQYHDKQLLFSFSKSSSTPYAHTILTQKWVNVVINYKRNEADLFINGELVHSYDFQYDVPMYDVTDNITVGDRQGIDGAICNIHYHTSPLSRIAIAYHYNTLVFSNPPV